MSAARTRLPAYGLCLLLLPTLAAARLSSSDPSPLGRRLPVLLLHGWNADESSWDRFVTAAGRQATVARRCKLYRFGYDWSQAIAASADRLRTEVAALPELRGRPLVLVGHSMGGLVARAWMESRDGPSGLDQVALLITLGTPHHGSPQANLEWLAGDSRYSLLARLLPLGLVELVDRIPIARAARTEGGRDLGWDNYDGAMPPEVWAGSSRYLRQLNDQLERHPQRDELLRRYRFCAGTLSSVAPLSVLRLQQQLRAGDHYGAGASLLAHAFHDAAGRAVTRWALNDGAVSLDSALFLRPGEPLTAPDYPELSQRARLPAAPVTISPGVDHGRLVLEPAAVQPVLEQLAAVEPDALALQRGEQVAVYTPGARWPPLMLGAVGEPLAAPRSDLVLAASGDLLAAVTPAGVRPLARTETAGPWRLSPTAELALAPDGALVGLLRPCYRRLPAWQPDSAIWSPDGDALAMAGAGSELLLIESASLRLTAGPRGARPLAWDANGRRLVADAGGVLAAVWRGDDRAIALVVEGARPATGLLLAADGTEQGRWSVPAGESPGPRLVVVTPGSRSFTAVAAPAQEPCWAPDGSWLAWRDAEGRLGLRRQTVTTTLSAREGRVAALAACRDGLLVLRLELPEGGCGLAVAEPGATAPRLLASAPTAGRGPVLISPSDRHAVCLLDSGLLLVSLDGALRTVLAAEAPLWLPSPAARGWAAPEASRP